MPPKRIDEHCCGNAHMQHDHQFRAIALDVALISAILLFIGASLLWAHAGCPSTPTYIALMAVSALAGISSALWLVLAEAHVHSPPKRRKHRS